MSQPQKKQKLDKTRRPDSSRGPSPSQPQPQWQKIYQSLLESSNYCQDHPFKPLLAAIREKKHPILQVVTLQNEVYKTNQQKKKKPIEQYLDTINHLYKKRDLDILINPVTPKMVFEDWSPRQVAVFQEAILKFGKQFEFIAQLIKTKNVKEVYEFYLEWKSTSHYKSYRGYVSSVNRNNIEDYV